jgi:hypothetical protein
LRFNGQIPDINKPKFFADSTGWSDAASNSYLASSVYGAAQPLANDLPALKRAIGGVEYPYRLMLIGTKSSSVDVPSCNQLPYDVIDCTYSFDLIYTDCSGPSPAIQRLPRALTVRIYE